MRTRSLLVSTLVLTLIASFAGSSSGAAGPNKSHGRGRDGLRVESGLPRGFVPAAARPGHRPLNRWFVVMKSLVCQGFWDGPSCGADDPIVVSAGSTGAGESHPILALFPNNNPKQVRVPIVRVTT